jgi:hypothetical protein
MKRIGKRCNIPFVYSDNKTDLLLRSEYLFPGDIILSTTRRPVSHLIRIGSFGPYSHAALVINGTAVFEAKSDGLGYTSIFPKRCERDSYDATKCLILSEVTDSHMYRVGVFRHREAYKLRPEHIKTTIDKLTQQEFGLQYPPLHKPGAAADIPLPPFVYDGIEKALSWSKVPISNPGSFCSEFVAKVYKELNLTIHHPPVPPNMVSPNSLARSVYLAFLDSLVVEPDPYAEEIKTQLDTLQDMPFISRDTLETMREARIVLEKAKAFLSAPNQLDRMAPAPNTQKYGARSFRESFRAFGIQLAQCFRSRKRVHE